MLSRHEWTKRNLVRENKIVVPRSGARHRRDPKNSDFGTLPLYLRAPHLGPWASGFGVVNSLERRFSLLLAKKVDSVLPSIK